MLLQVGCRGQNSPMAPRPLPAPLAEWYAVGGSPVPGCDLSPCPPPHTCRWLTGGLWTGHSALTSRVSRLVWPDHSHPERVIRDATGRLGIQHSTAVRDRVPAHSTMPAEAAIGILRNESTVKSGRLPVRHPLSQWRIQPNILWEGSKF